MKINLFFVFILLPFILKAQQGTLDKSFADSGILVDLNHQGVINKIGLQSDGKIIAAGAGDADLSTFFLLARYNTDGTLDSSFGINGVVGSNQDLSEVFGLTIQIDDKIIGLGHTAKDIKLVRYQSNGGVDSSFGSNGMVITNIGNADEPGGIVLQPDGKIVVCGYIINDPNEARQLFLVRYLPDGSLDNNFGDGGIEIVGEPNGDKSFYSANAVALQPNGQIVVAAYLTKGAVYRFNPDGTLDINFGNNGLAYFQTKDVGIKNFIPYDIAVQPDGKIIGGGNGGSYMAASRLNADGSIDSSFGNNGIQHVIIGSDIAHCTAMLLQKDTRIILTGWIQPSNFAYANFALARLNNNGSIDSSFGENGITVTAIGTTLSTSSSSVLDAKEKIIMGGVSGSNFALARYNNDLTKKQIIIAKIRRWIQHHNGIMWDNISGIKNYTIQRSGDGAHWSTVYKTHGNSNTHSSISHSQLTIHNYYNDPSPLPGTNYYRLQTTSTDGAVQYSNILAITNNDAIKISPNPAKNILHIEGLSSKARITVISFNGFTAISQQLMANGSYNLNIASLQPGNYLLKIEMNGEVVTKKFLKE